MNDPINQYQLRFSRIQALMRQQIPGFYRVFVQLYLRFLSIDGYRLKLALKQAVRKLRSSKESSLTFVQVGSNDGLTNDPIRSFVLENKSIAILIEPVPNCFLRLQANYAAAISNVDIGFDIRLRNLAIGPISGNQKFFAVSPRAKEEIGEQLPEWWDQIGSFDRNHITRHLNGILAPYIDELDVATFRLSELLTAEQIGHVDLLHIDAEGYDLEILKSLNPSEITVSCILIEWKHLSDKDLAELMALLDAQGYIVRKFKSDLLALSRTL